MEKQRAMNGSLKKMKVNFHFHILLVSFSLLGKLHLLLIPTRNYYDRKASAFALLLLFAPFVMSFLLMFASVN